MGITAQPYTIADIRRERERRRWRENPVAFARERLRHFLWSKQREILEAVRDHDRVAVQSCHGVGKSFIASDVAAWWIEVHPAGSAFVLTTAPTTPQVKTVLWRYIRRAHVAGKLRGRLNQVEWLLTPPNGQEEIVGLGRKPADVDPAAFQGFHARNMLVIVDEACGVSENIFNAAAGIASNVGARQLAIGNPDDPFSHFAKICRPGSGWHVIRIAAEDSPNFTGEMVPRWLRAELVSREYVEQAKREWGEQSPIYISKVLGQFPESREDTLIPLSWILRAQERWRELGGWPETFEAGLPHRIGTDVGGGHDKSTIYESRGDWVRRLERHSSPDTMAHTGKVIRWLHETGATEARVDFIGIGHGVVDRGRELGEPFVDVNVGLPAQDSIRFENLRAEGYWSLRKEFQDGTICIDPADDALASQLGNMRYSTTSRGKTIIESKDAIKGRGLPSPDDADAVMLARLPSTFSAFEQFVREENARASEAAKKGAA